MTSHRFTAEARWRGAIAILLMTSLIAPLLIGYDFFFPFVVPRNIFFRVVVELAAAAFILFALFEKKRIVLRGEWILWALVAFVAVTTLSAILSPAPNHSFFGDFERMGGVWAWVHFTLFFLLLRTLRDEDWTRLLNVAVTVGVLISVNAIIEHSKATIYERAGTSVFPATSSTIGNSGLLGGYLVLVFGITCYLGSRGKRSAIFYSIPAAVELTAIIFAQNRSSLIGILLGAVVGGALFATLSTNGRRRWVPSAAAAGLTAVLVGLAAVAREFPASRIVASMPELVRRLALTSSFGSERTRPIQWRAALEGFLDRPVFGYGLENYNLVWSAHFDPRIYALDTDVYDHAHNQFLELLATTGLAGTAVFIAIWLAISVALVRAYRERRVSAAGLAILTGVQLAYATYLTFWFVDLNSTMIWLVFAALIAMLANPVTMVRPIGVRQREARWLPPVGAVATAALLVVVLAREAYRPLRVSRALAEIDASHEPVSRTLALFDDAISTTGGQTSHTPFVLTDFLGGLSENFAEFRNDPREYRAIDNAFQEAILAFRTEIHRDTLNDRLYTQFGRLLLAASHLYESDSLRLAAISELEHAIALSPHRIQQRLTLATALLEGRDTLQAQGVLADAVRADPELGEPRFRLAALYLARGRTDSAAVSIRKSLTLGYVGKPEVYLAIGKRLEFARHAPEAAALYSEYLEAKYTKAVWEPSGTIERSIPAADIAVAAHLPLLYARAEESELAIKSAAALALFDPAQSLVVDRFVTDVGTRRRRSWLARNTLLPCETQRSRITRDSVAIGACAVFRRKL